MKKVLSLILTVVLTMSLMPANLFAVTATAATSSFDGGSGTATDPYLISTKTQLNNVRNYLNAHFKLTRNIEFATSDFGLNGSFYNGGKRWLPIGITDSQYNYNYFTGSFDGNGFAIKNLYIDNSIGIAGLFGYNSGVIKNLYIIDCKFYTSDSSSSNSSASATAGVVVANNNGTIINCCITGAISASASAIETYAYVGGIAGYNKGTVTNCYNTATIYGKTSTSYYQYGGSCGSTYVGGIVGYNKNIVTDCYNIGNVSAKAVRYSSMVSVSASVGGIVGYNTGTITSCYNTSIVISDSDGSASVGGIVGYNNKTINNCYFMDSVDKGVGSGTNPTRKCTAEQLAQQSTYVGFNFENVWIMNPLIQPYPMIKTLHYHIYDSVCDADCNECGSSRVAPHNYVWIIDKENNCGVNGTKHELCLICDATRNVNTIIPATKNHSYDDDCDTICNVCEQSRVVSHFYEWVIDENNNCGVDGTKHEECNACHAKRNENTIIPATDIHTFTNLYDNECDVCNQVFYKVIFNSNGGTEIATQAVRPDTISSIPTEAPTRSGYNFVGWSTSKNGDVEYQSGDILSSLNKSIILYAQWDKKCSITENYNCSTCSGKGKIPEYVECDTCYGRGRDWEPESCSTCDGDGRIGKTCTQCGGSGETWRCRTCFEETGRNTIATATCMSEHTIYWGECLTCWGKGQIIIACSICSGAGTVRKYFTCASCSGLGRVYDYIKCTRCSGNGTLSKTCTKCNGTGNLIRNTVSAPNTPILESVTANLVILVTITNGEYSIDGATWQDSPVFDGLEEGKEYSFYQRYAKTDTTYASVASTVLKILAHNHRYTLNNYYTCDVCMYSKTPSAPVLERKSYNSVTLIAIDGFEYSKDGVTWQESNVFTNLTAETEHTFYQRVKGSQIALVSEKSPALVVTTDEEPVYTVVFKDWDGKILSTRTYHYGDTVTSLTNPTRLQDDVYIYTFTGWDKDITVCDGNKVYTATYTSTFIDYTVVFKNWNGTVLSTNTYHYGDVVELPEEPTKEKDGYYVYTFAGWNKAVVPCDGNAEYTATFDGEHYHTYKTSVINPTCTNKGYTKNTCTCGNTYNDKYVNSLGHTYSNNCDKTCNVCGATRTVGAHKYTNSCDTTCNYCNAKRTIKHTYTNNCDTKCNVCSATRTITHTYKTTTTKATLTKNGSIVKKCTVCSKVASTTTIKYAKTFTLSTTSYTYNGKVKTPTVTVKDSSGKTLTKGTDYTVTYASGRTNAGTYKVTVTMKGKYSGTKTLTFKINPAKLGTCTLSSTTYTYDGKVKAPTVTVKNASGTKLTKNTHYTVTYATGRKNVGTYKVTIKGKGNYTGTKTLTFKIYPAKTTVSKLTPGTKKITVAITKKSTQVTGYQVQYSTSKTFSKATTKTISSYNTTKTTLTGLSAKKTYFVRVRTYKTVNGTKYYSGWSTYKYTKTK